MPHAAVVPNGRIRAEPAVRTNSRPFADTHRPFDDNSWQDLGPLADLHSRRKVCALVDRPLDVVLQMMVQEIRICIQQVPRIPDGQPIAFHAYDVKGVPRRQALDSGGNLNFPAFRWLDVLEEGFSVFAHAEEVRFLLELFRGPAAVGAAAVHELGLGPEGLAGGAVPVLVLAEVDVPFGLDILEELEEYDW